VSYRGRDAVEKFIEKLLEEVKICNDVMKTEFSKEMEFTDEDNEKFKTSNSCHICGVTLRTTRKT
jgi:hypothetical protein